MCNRLKELLITKLVLVLSSILLQRVGEEGNKAYDGWKWKSTLPIGLWVIDIQAHASFVFTTMAFVTSTVLYEVKK